MDGEARRFETVAALGRACTLVPVCPEQLGGLPTPRPSAEIQGGTGEDVLAGRVRIETEAGSDVTGAFVRGAEQVLEVARIVGATGAVLKARSPSCGVHQTYDGTFSGRLREGSGVCAALLLREGLSLFTEEARWGGRSGAGKVNSAEMRPCTHDGTGMVGEDLS